MVEHFPGKQADEIAESGVEDNIVNQIEHRVETDVPWCPGEHSVNIIHFEEIDQKMLS